MKAKLISEHEYNGMFWSTIRSLNEPVVVLGVMHPVDPGCVLVKRKSGKEETVPEFAIVPALNIDWTGMMTDEQKKVRERIGGLLGNGLGTQGELVPIDQVKRKATK